MSTAVTTMGKERQREFTYPEGMTSVVEFATLIGATYGLVNKWAKFDYIPIHRISARKMCVRYEEAIRAEVVVKFLQRNGKPLPPPDLEETAIIPRVPERPLSMEPAYVADPVPEWIAPKPVPLIERKMPEPSIVIEKEEALFLHSRQAAQPYIDQARKCAAKGERQAERVLLWMALEQLGFPSLDSQPAPR